MWLILVVGDAFEEYIANLVWFSHTIEGLMLIFTSQGWIKIPFWNQYGTQGQ